VPRHAVESISVNFQYRMVLHGSMVSFGLRSQFDFAPRRDFLVQLPVDLPPVMGSVDAVTLGARQPAPLAQQLIENVHRLVGTL
jgi:hypothetical protein